MFSQSSITSFLKNKLPYRNFSLDAQNIEKNVSGIVLFDSVEANTPYSYGFSQIIQSKGIFIGGEITIGNGKSTSSTIQEF